MAWCKHFPTVFMLSFLCFLISPSICAEQTAFVPFIWHGGELSWGYCEKAVLLVPVHIPGDSRTFLLQLDTGCESTFIYGDRLAAFGLDIDSGKYDMTVNWYNGNPEIGTSDIPIWWRDKADKVDTTNRNIGTLGSSFMANRILVIDFPGQEFAIFEDTCLVPKAIKDSAGYVPAQNQDNRLYVTVILGDDTLKSVLFDTGASDFTLVLPDEEWYRHTGLRGDEPSVKKYSVPSWGKQVEVSRAEAISTLRFGKINVEKPLVDRIGWTTPKGSEFRLMGNALFSENYTIVLDFVNSRVGVMPSSVRQR